jgi:hypothetical protein
MPSPDAHGTNEALSQPLRSVSTHSNEGIATIEFQKPGTSTTLPQVDQKPDKSLEQKCSSNDNSSEKAAWDDSVIIFNANSEGKVVYRRRRAFSPRRRKEVAQIRRIGVCFQCKIRKGPVS